MRHWAAYGTGDTELPTKICQPGSEHRTMSLQSSVRGRLLIVECSGVDSEQSRIDEKIDHSRVLSVCSERRKRLWIPVVNIWRRSSFVMIPKGDSRSEVITARVHNPSFVLVSRRVTAAFQE